MDFLDKVSIVSFVFQKIDFYSLYCLLTKHVCVGWWQLAQTNAKVALIKKS